MTVSASNITFDVKDMKIYPLSSDTTSTYTQGTGVQVFGIQEVSLEPNFITNELKGDGGVVLAKKGKMDRLNFSCTYSSLDLDVLALLFGNSVTDGGSSPSQTAALTLNDTSLPYFAIQVLIDDLQNSSSGSPAETDAAEIILNLKKCQVTGGSLFAGSTDSFNNPTFTAEAIIPNLTSEGMGVITVNEAATGLS